MSQVWRSFVFLLLTFLIATCYGGEVRAKVVCYYGQWSNIIDKIPGDKCTHVIYGFIGLNESNWRYKFLENNDERTKKNIRQFLELKNRFPEVKLLISVGGGSETSPKYSRMAEVSARRSTFIESIVAFLNEFRFDGVDMDWEYPGWSGGRAVDKTNFVTLMRDLRNATGGKELTMAATVVEKKVETGYDVPALCNIVDAVHLMNYNLRGWWDGFADIPSPLFPRSSDTGKYRNLNTEGGTLLWSQRGCPWHKLIVGAPFYGKEYVLQNETNNSPGAAIDKKATRALPQGGALSYHKICNLIKAGGWTLEFDDQIKCPYMFNGTRWIGYEDSRSLQLKMDWIRNQSFGGAMLWAVQHDDYNGQCGPKYPLLNILFNSMDNFTITTP